MLVDLYATAIGAMGGSTGPGVALAAVGSLARRELGPRSDIDLVLVHDGRDANRIQAIADSVWYPLWDSGVRLDHSVRTIAECGQISARELSAAVGLLDLRLIAGDATLIAQARTTLLGAWRTGARRRLPELLATLEERLRSFGDAAYLLEADLKEARGGFRDMTVLRALAATWLTDRPHEGVSGPYERLLDVRDALHLSSGRALDRLLASEAEAVADQLGLDDTDTLHGEVSLAARRIGHAVDLTSRAARQAVPQRRVLSFGRRQRRPVFETADHGLIVHEGEVALGSGTNPVGPAIGLQAAALAARRELVLSPISAANLGAHAVPMPAPWPAAAREALLELLATGDALVPVWEALDLAEAIVTWIPAWAGIRARPQHNPIHRHTVDRHSVQTVAEAGRHLSQVDRPDLLLLAALFHDIGKLPGAGARHPEVGAPIAAAAVTEIGLPAADVAVVERLVREHLTLADLATHRDHGDPATQAALSAAVDGRLDMLYLLRYLTEADARAAGPAAWTPWRAQLIRSLTARTAASLRHESPRLDVETLVDPRLASGVASDGRPRISVHADAGGGEVVVAAPDRLGLFGDTAGLLTVHGLQVRSAAMHIVDGVAVNTWRVDGGQDLPNAPLLVQELQRLSAGDEDILAPLLRRELRAQRRGAVAVPYVGVVADASSSATVVEVRTGDRPGLLYVLGSALDRAGLSIRSAHIATLAGQALDTFYLTEPDGTVPDDDRTRDAVAVLTGAAIAASPA